MPFWDELRRRNVVKVAVAYAIVGWLLVQVADTLLPIFEAPRWTIRVFTFFARAGGPAPAYPASVNPAGPVTEQRRDVLPNSVAVLLCDNFSTDPENAFVEIAQGDAAAAATQLERAERLLGRNRQAVFLPELAYSYRRIDRPADVDRIVAEIGETSDSIEIGAGGWAMVSLAEDDRERAIEQLRAAAAKIENHQIDEGLWNFMNIRMNVTADPVLEEPPFVDLRNRLRGN
jgi:hypothetical protein